MKGLILYNQDDRIYNKWFINHITDIGVNYGVEILNPDISNLQACKSLKPNFVLNRTRNFEISKFFENLGIRCFNNSLTCEIGNDKWKIYQMFKQLSLPCMPTEFYHHGDDMTKTRFPCVVKSLDGHGGGEVFMVNSETELGLAINKISKSEFIVQKPASPVGCDVRLYMLGDKIVKSVLRTSDNDFRSNYSLGGNVELFEPTEFQRNCAYTIQNYLLSDYIGIDFIRYGNEWVLNEIEDNAGARMLYSLAPDFDICEHYIKHIIKSMK